MDSMVRRHFPSGTVGYIRRPYFVEKVKSILRSQDCVVVGAPKAGKTSFLWEIKGEQDLLVACFSGDDDYSDIWKSSVSEAALSRFVINLVKKFHDAAGERGSLAARETARIPRTRIDRLQSSLDSYHLILLRRKEPSTLEHIAEIARRLRDFSETITPVLALDDFDRLCTELSPSTVSLILEALRVFSGEGDGKIRQLLTSSRWPDDKWFLCHTLDKRSLPGQLTNQLERLSREYTPVTLPLLTERESEEIGREVLSREYQEDRDTARDVLKRTASMVYAWSGGHPVLVRKMFYSLSQWEQGKYPKASGSLKEDVFKMTLEDDEVDILMKRIKETMTSEERQNFVVISKLLRGEIPSELKGIIDKEALENRTLPSEISSGGLNFRFRKVVLSFTRRDLFVEQADETECERKAAELIWVGDQAYLPKGTLFWEVIGHDDKSLQSIHSRTERLKTWLLVNYPKISFLQASYFSFLIYWSLWLLFGFLGVDQKIAFLVFVPLLVYVFWSILYSRLSHRRQ